MWRDLILSLALHIVFWSALGLIPEPPKPEAPLTFEVLPKMPPPSKPNQSQASTIVRNTEVKENDLRESEDPTKFLSEKTQRVKQQTRAAQSGLTVNRSAQPSLQTTSQAQAKSTEKDEKSLDRFLPSKIKFPTAGQDKSKAQAKAPVAPLNPNFTEIGSSTLAESLPSDIKVGEITALSTDRYLFYSYFARAQELLWNEWAPHIEDLLTRVPASMLSSPNNHFTTSLEVWFYPDGTLHSTHLMKPSGIPELDSIAEMSFKNIHRIPNPPKEKIEKDGLLRFQWGLTVEYDPKVLVRK